MNTLSQHTPGPWWILKDGITVCPPRPRAQSIICRTAECYMDRKQREANALLIASAPDLLAALKRMVDVPGGEGGDFHAIAAARAAIAKATGEGA